MKSFSSHFRPAAAISPSGSQSGGSSQRASGRCKAPWCRKKYPCPSSEDCGREEAWYSPPGSDCRAKRGRTKKSAGTVRGRDHGRTRPASGTGAGTRSSGWHQRSRHPAHGPHGAAPYPGPGARRPPAPDNRTAGPDNLCSTAPRLRPGENPAPWRPGRPHHPPRRHRRCPTSGHPGVAAGPRPEGRRPRATAKGWRPQGCVSLRV